MNLEQKVNFWKKHANKEMVKQINKMSADEIKKAFCEQMQFGTAGIRGKIGPGSNQMNIYNIIKPTYGFAKFLKNKYKNQEIKVVIGTDNRHKREEFSQVAADVLTSFGIKVLKTSIVPTPIISFAIRENNAQGGIIITASHNPADNNGYKVYDETGSQLLPESSRTISEISSEREEYLTYKYTPKSNLITKIPKSTFTNYRKKILNMDGGALKELKLVFSPQHGTSAEFIPEYLENLGYEVIKVDEQMSHDPNFSNTPTPNPESPLAYRLGIKYAKKNNADIFITTDPDADRIGVAAKKRGEFKILNGNQLAPIIFDYIIKNNDINNSMMIYSYVSTHLCELMAKKHGIESIVVATGFKWIGDIIEKRKDKKYIFGFEESYGSLIDGSIARDKDSIQAAVIVSSIANKAKKEGKTLWDILEDIYLEYGYFDELTQTMTFDGVNAIEDRVKFMEKLRLRSKSLFKDEYDIVDLSKGHETIAPMNLIRFSFKDGSWIAARPSGTEPKIKFYRVGYSKEKNILKNKVSKLDIYIKKIMDLK